MSGLFNHQWMMLKWIIIPLLIVFAICYFFCDSSFFEFNHQDIYVFCAGIGLLVWTYAFTPWNEIASSREFHELQLQNPSLDLSTPLGVAKGLSSGLIVFGVAAAADATGFGIFMTSASALGAVGASFTTISTSMSVLGFLLTPYVYIGIASITAFAVVMNSIKTGNALLSDAMVKIIEKDWQEAYRLAVAASEKVFFTVESWQIENWQNFIYNSKQSRFKKLIELEKFMNNMSKDEEQEFMGWFNISLPLSAIISGICVYFDFGFYSVVVVFYALASYVSERMVSSTMVDAIKLPPQLHAEIKVLEVFDSIKFNK